MSAPRVLTIAGSDSSGGAGIQADIKTITMLGGYAMSAITAVTAQSTQGVQRALTLPAALVLEQMSSCIDDIGVDAIKIGMLGNEEIVRHVAAGLVAAPEIAARSALGHARKKRPPGVERFPIVLDPVMVATSGDLLADEATIAAMRARLFPLATVLTPNLPELEILAGRELGNLTAMGDAALELARQYGCAVLAKGGHSDDERVVDILVPHEGRAVAFDHPRIATRHTHGSGCTLSAALATLIGHGLPLEHAVRLARKFVYRAIEAAPGFGFGSGPLGHHAVRGGQASSS